MKTLEQARKEKGITKVDMARELGVSRPTYAAYEKDPYHNMTIDVFRRACRIIGVDTSEIFFTNSDK